MGIVSVFDIITGKFKRFEFPTGVKLTREEVKHRKLKKPKGTKPPFLKGVPLMGTWFIKRGKRREVR